jgi:hypothetical protein
VSNGRRGSRVGHRRRAPAVTAARLRHAQVSADVGRARQTDGSRSSDQVATLVVAYDWTRLNMGHRRA